MAVVITPSTAHASGVPNTLTITGVTGEFFIDLLSGSGAFSSFNQGAGTVVFTPSTDSPCVVRASSNPWEGANTDIGDVNNGFTLQSDGNWIATSGTNSGFSVKGSARLNNKGDYSRLDGLEVSGQYLYSHYKDNTDATIIDNAQENTNYNRCYLYNDSDQPAIQYGTKPNTIVTGSGLLAAKTPPFYALYHISGNMPVDTIIKRPEVGNDSWSGGITGNSYGITGYEQGTLELTEEGEVGEWVEVFPDDAGWSGGTEGTLSGSLAYNPTSIADAILKDYRTIASGSMTLTKTGLAPNAWVKIELYFAHFELVRATNVLQDSSLLCKARFGYNTKRVKFIFGWIQADGDGDLVLTFSGTDAIFNYARFRTETPDYSAITHQVFDEGDSLLEPYQYDINGEGDNYKGLSRLLAEFFGGNLGNHRLFEIYDPANAVSFINLHNAGEAIADMAANAADQIDDKYDAGLTQILLFQGGTNNYTSSGATIYGLHKDYLDDRQTACPDLKIIPVGAPPRHEDTSNHLEDFNEEVRTNLVSDAREDFVDTTEIDAYLTDDWETDKLVLYRDNPDWLHLSQAGQNVIFNKVVAKITTLLPGITYAITGDAYIDNGTTFDYETNVPSPVWSKTSGLGTIDDETGELTAPGSGTGTTVIRAEKSDDAGIFATKSITWGVAAPVASFTLDHSSVVAGESVTATDTSTGGTSRQWSLEGDETSTASPYVIDTDGFAPGTYTVLLEVVNAGGSDTESHDFTVTEENPLVFETTSLPNGRIGVFYNQSITVSGGVGAKTLRVIQGGLPPGLVIGSITGYPTAPGIYTFTAECEDEEGHTNTHTFTITILPVTEVAGYEKLQTMGHFGCQESIAHSRIKSPFGDGFGRSLLFGAKTGLKRWQLKFTTLPQTLSTYNPYLDTDFINKADYLWDFYCRYAVSGESFVIESLRNNQYYLAEFTDEMLTFDMMLVKLYTTGLGLQQRREKNVSVFDLARTSSPLRLYEADQLGLANNANVTTFTDSINASVLTGTSTYPLYKTNIQNGKGVIRFSGTSNPLTNSSTFSFRHLWIVAKYAGATFSGTHGLITDLAGWGGLLGVNAGTVFTSLNDLTDGIVWTAKVNGVEVDPTAIPAPMNVWKLIEIRPDIPVSMAGLSLGQDRANTSRKWNGDISEVFFSEDKVLESDVFEIEENLMRKWGLT